MTAGRTATVLLLGLAGSAALAAAALRERHDPQARRAVVLRAVAASLGTGSLALSAGGAARHPMEGPAGCLGDMPAGYCLHAACDVVTCPGPAGDPVDVERRRAPP
jgi:hypothetical protein